MICGKKIVNETPIVYEKKRTIVMTFDDRWQSRTM